MRVGNLTYTYDNLGNIKTVKEGTELKESYTYDSLNQLVRHNSVTQNKTIVYTYDAGGNILNRKEYAYTTDADLSALTPEITVPYTYGDTTWKDKLTAYDGQSIAYDAIGNPITYRGWSNTWQGRQLSSTSQGGMTLSFKYNVDGIRTQKTVNGTATNYFLNGNKILAQKTGSTVTWFYYDQQGTRVAMEHGGKLYYYLYNLQGDVIALCDASSKQIVAKYSYDAWGKLLTKENLGTGTIADVNPFRYRGYYYDSETGMYYLNARYYDPEVGRFLSADSQLNPKDGALGHNLFAYCNNNPVMQSDPSGRSIILACIIVGAIVGALAGGHIAAKASKKKTGKVNGWAVAGGILGGAVVGGLIGWGIGAAATAIGAAATGTAATTAAPVVEKAVEKTSTAIQTYYPPNNGFSGTVEKISLDVGTVIQRTGDFAGRFTAPVGTPSEMLSLPYDKIGQTTTCLQTTQPVQALSGTVAPWFGQIGGGTQYLLLDGSVDQLLTEGILKIFGE